MSELLHHTMASIKQTTLSAETLGQLAKSISALIGHNSTGLRAASSAANGLATARRRTTNLGQENERR